MGFQCSHIFGGENGREVLPLSGVVCAIDGVSHVGRVARHVAVEHVFYDTGLVPIDVLIGVRIGKGRDIWRNPNDRAEVCVCFLDDLPPCTEPILIHRP